MIRTSAARVASSVFNRALAYRFCVNFAPLDPRKHITMNHNHHNMYLDSYEYGQYPDWVHPCSVAPRTYESNVVNILAQSLSEHFGTPVTAELLNSKRNRSWGKFLSKDLKTNQQFHEIYPSLLGKLAFGFFVKQSRFTWITQQRFRFDYTMSSFDAETPLTVGDFINRYNEDIEFCVLASNYGFAAEIDQAQSALQKHFEQEQEQELQLVDAPGVADLRYLDKEHNTFINRLLALLH